MKLEARLLEKPGFIVWRVRDLCQQAFLRKVRHKKGATRRTPTTEAANSRKLIALAGPVAYALDSQAGMSVFHRCGINYLPMQYSCLSVRRRIWLWWTAMEALV